MSKHEKLDNGQGKIIAIGLAAGLGFAGIYGFNAATKYSKDTFGDEYAIFDISSQFLTQSECKTKLSVIPHSNSVIFGANSDSETVLPPNQDIIDKYLPYSKISEIAKNHDLTIFDSSKAKLSIKEAENKEEVVDSINGFTSSFGIEVKAPDGSSYQDLNHFIPISEAGYSTQKLKKRGVEITNLFSSIPYEVSLLGNIDEIRLVEKNSFQGFGTDFLKTKEPHSYYNPYTRTITVGLGSERNPIDFQKTLSASVASAIDIEVCGIFGAEFDNVFNEFDITKKENVVAESKNINLNKTIDELNNISNKAKLIGKYLSPNPINTITSASLEERSKVFLQILRIDSYVPGYADFWKELSLEYSSGNENVLLNNMSIQDDNST